jgi:beta-glucanase (GH16 family)
LLQNLTKLLLSPGFVIPAMIMAGADVQLIAGKNYQLVWRDEFNGTSIDASKWNKFGPWGHPVASNWTGHFSYLRSNVSEANGVATITVHNTGGGPGGTWTGGILSTDTTKWFRYGFVEVRAKLPKGQGFWPAIWLYGSNRSKDEMDMMEFLGGDPTTVYLSYVYSGGQQQFAPKSSDWTSDYHLFQMKWEPGRLTYYVDNVQTGTWSTNVSARPKYLMLNFDVGDGASPWGGYPNSSTPTTAQFNVDYVRVFQQP